MPLQSRSCLVAAGLLAFVVLPLALYALTDVPVRAALPEGLSILTLLAFILFIAQFFLSRCLPAVPRLFGPLRVQWLHRTIAYGAVSVLLLHPFLIVLPRYFQPGVRPLDALVTMLTTLDNLGVVLGLVAWVLMLVLGVTGLWRMRMIRRLHIRYRGWRSFHAGLAVAALALGLWHAVELGRHTGWLLGSFLVILGLAAVGLLARLYLPERPRALSSVDAKGARA